MLRLGLPVGTRPALAFALGIALLWPSRPAAAQNDHAHPAAGASARKVLQLEPPAVFDRLTTDNGLPQSDVAAMAQDRTGFVWLGTQSGLARYDGHEMKVYLPKSGDPTSVSGSTITALATDAKGRVWVGTDEHGVSLYDPRTDHFQQFSLGKKGDQRSANGAGGVVAMLVDHKDRTWLATGEGVLALYHPQTKTFERFTRAPFDAPIAALAVDKAGNLWLGSDNGLIRFNPDTHSTHVYKGTDQANLFNVHITAVTVDSHGDVWVGTHSRGLLRLDPSSGAVTAYRAHGRTGLSSNAVTSILEARSGSLWVGTRGGLDRLDRKRNRFVAFHHVPGQPRSLGGEQVQSLFQDRGGVIWVGTLSDGASTFQEARLKFGYYATDVPILCFRDEPGGVLWAGSYYGIYEINRNTQRVTVYQTIGDPDAGGLDLRSTRILAIYKDKTGPLWLGSDAGLIRFDPHSGSYKIYRANPDDPHALHSEWVLDIWKGPQGDLWLATGGGGLERFNPSTETFAAFTSSDRRGLTSDFIYALYPDPTSKNILWLGTAKGGLDRFDLRTEKATSYTSDPKHPNRLSNDDVTSVYRAGDNLWVGTYGGGLDHIDLRTNKVKAFTTANSTISNDDVYGVLPDSAGKLWLSTNGGGLLRFDPKTGAFTRYGPRDGVQASEFAEGSFWRSPYTGELFFGGIHGLNAFFPKQLKPSSFKLPVVITKLRLFNRHLSLSTPVWTDPKLNLAYNDSFELDFAALGFADPKGHRFAYKLEGFDDNWIKTNRRFATYSKLSGGNYTFRVRASNGHGVWNEKGVALHIHVRPAPWKTWWAYAAYALALFGIVFAFVRRSRQKVAGLERDARLAAAEKDLELTGAVQTAFLPKMNELNDTRLRLVGFYRPASACGGDWWWYDRPSEGTYSVLVGDVTGHGPGPAMVTAAVATAVHVQTGGGAQPMNAILESLNREVQHVGGGHYHMTMVAIQLDEKTGNYVAFSAGAPPILKLSGDRVSSVPLRGTPLGSDDFVCGVAKGQLLRGERLLLYTDGIPELMMKNGKQLGMRRFSKFYQQAGQMDLREATAFITEQSDLLRAGPQDDDWTLAMIEWH